MEDQTRLDDIISSYTDAVLSGREAPVLQEFESEARVIQALHRVIAPDKGMDAAMRSRLNQRINAEWDQHRKKSQRKILSFPTGRYVPLAAGLAILIGVVAIVMGDSSGSDVSATAQGDSGALVVVGVMAAVVLVGGFLFFLWNRRR